MTKKSINAAPQVKLVRELTTKINDTSYIFVNDHEVQNGLKILEGDWLTRLDGFINDHASGIGNDAYEQKVAKALITRRYMKYLDRKVVDKLTNCLKAPKYTDNSTKAQRLAKVARDIKKV